MVVDDEEFCITAMVTMIKQCAIDTHHLVDLCINGKEAIEKLVNSYENGM